MKARGLAVAPQAAVGDGALGFWKALDEAFPTTRHQRRWLHKTLNVLDKLPKSMQRNARKDLREIWPSPSRAAVAQYHQGQVTATRLVTLLRGFGIVISKRRSFAC